MTSVQATTPRVSAATAVTVLAVLACAVVLLVNYDKAIWDGVQGWGRPYWWLDYRFGLVRRGLVGTLFQAGFGRLDEAHLGKPVHILNELCSLFLGGALLGALAVALHRTQDAARRAWIVAAGLWCAAAEVWPTLAYNQGYLDILTLSCALAAALALRFRGRSGPWIAGVLMAAGPFIHEYFAFLIPFVLACDPSLRPRAAEAAPVGRAEILSLESGFEERREIPWRLLILAAVGFAACAVVTFGASAPASREEIALMPLPPQDQAVLADTTLTQSFGKSLQDNVGLLLKDVPYTAKNFAFFLAPSLVAALSTLFWRGGRPSFAAWFRVAAGLFPLAALLIAWDLSRLLVMTNFTAGLLFLLTAGDWRDDTPAEPRRQGWKIGLCAILGAVGLLYAAAPMAYVYYEPGPATLFPLKVWPSTGASTFGVEHLWKNAHNTALPTPAAAAAQ